MKDEQLAADACNTSAAADRVPAASPFLVLYRIRRAAFRQGSVDLYRRYGQVIVLSLALFGILLKERPGLLAEPLLHFWRAPGELLPDLAFGAAWMALVAAWTAAHGAPIRGGALARYCHSLPLARRTHRLVDLSILGLALPVFLLPFAVALWIAIRAGDALGADGRFPVYLLLFASLTLTTAQAVAFGPQARTRLVAGATLAALVGAPWLPAPLLAPLAVAALAGVALACTGERPAPGHAAGGRAPPLRVPVLLRIQAGVLLHRHRHEGAMRLLLSSLPQLAAWWMIVYADKGAQAWGFLHVGCAFTVCLTSGWFHTLHVAAGSLRPWLRSMPYGLLRMTLAAHLLVLALSLLLFGATLAALASSFGPRHGVTLAMAQVGAYWLAWLPLLGLPFIQRHKDGVLFKFALVAVALLIAFHL